MPRTQCTHSERIKAFWEKVEITDLFDCWIWTGGKDSAGYGRIWLDGKHQKAHRIAWQIVFGEIPNSNTYHGTCVCHKCDNPPCVNPAHLFLGTNADNIADKVKKGRTMRGEAHSKAKLKEHDVIAIRKLSAEGWSQRKIAKKFGVGKSTIGQLINRITWKHI